MCAEARIQPCGVAQMECRDWPGRVESEPSFGEDFRLINNRQSGRRRGRGGGGRPPGSNPGPGNRQDNRQRGNAAQLLEKYKGLARDAQMQGDRVQTEYYLQYADHYFRVLSESRSRYEEQRRQRGEDDGAEDEGEDEIAAEANETEDAAPRRERPREREDRGQRNGEYRARRPRGQRDEESEGEDEGGERIALDSLPPSIAPAASSDEEGEEEKPARAPRRRATRRPRAADEEGTAAA